MAHRKTARPIETTVWEQDGKRVVREHDSRQYRAELYGAPIGWFGSQHEAEQAANEALYQALIRKAA